MRTFCIIWTLLAITGLTGTAFGQDTIRYNGSSTILKAIMFDASRDFTQETGIKFDLKGNNTSYGIKKLLAGECDIAGGGRPLKPAEKEKGLVETKMFLDAYAFIVHPTNPLNKISSEELSGILHGTISKWDDIGGPAGNKIIILSPPEKSAHYNNARKIIGFTKLPPNSMTADMPPNVYKKVKSFPAAIGWLSSSNVMGKSDIKILAIEHDGKEVTISQEHLVSGSYPYQQTMYFYTQGPPQGGIKDFVDFMKGSKGQQIITQAGFFLTD